MFQTKLVACILFSIYLSQSAWGGGSNSHEIKDLFETIRGKVFSFIDKTPSQENLELSKSIHTSDCSDQEQEIVSTIESLTSEWKSSRPKNLEAELPKSCVMAMGHLSKKFCPSEARSQFEFNFFIDVTDCLDVPQKQILPFLYFTEPQESSTFDKSVFLKIDKSSCQRLHTLMQVLDEGPLKKHLLHFSSGVYHYALAAKTTAEMQKKRKLSEEQLILQALANIKNQETAAAIKQTYKRVPASSTQAKSSIIPFNEATRAWLENGKQAEQKLHSTFGNGVCAISPDL